MHDSASLCHDSDFGERVSPVSNSLCSIEAVFGLRHSSSSGMVQYHTLRSTAVSGCSGVRSTGTRSIADFVEHFESVEPALGHS